MASRHWTSLIFPHNHETMGMALSIPHWALVPLITLELLLRSTSSKDLETEGHFVWLWVVLEAAHSQGDCDPLLPKGAALLWGPKGGPWFLSPAQQTQLAKSWSLRGYSQSRSASDPHLDKSGWHKLLRRGGCLRPRGVPRHALTWGARVSPVRPGLT